MPRSKTPIGEPKYNKALANFIFNKVEEGMTVRDICIKFAGQVPIEKTIYRWKKKYPEFRQGLNDAYNTFFYMKIDELEYLSTAPLPEDERSRMAELKQRHDRIDVLKFILTKIAPRLVPELQEAPKGPSILHIPAINVINYSDASLDVKK